MLSGMMQAGFFGSAALAPITYTIAVKGFATPTATGNNDVTSADITGVTPEAAIIISTPASAVNTETADAAVGLAFLTTTSQLIWTASDNGRTTTVVSRIGRTDSAIYVRQVGNSSVESQATGSFISGGVRLNYSIATVARRAALIAFTDVSAASGTVSLGTGTSAIDVTAPGFLPDVVFLLSTNHTFAQTANATLGAAFGIAVRTGEQFAVSWSEANGAADGAPAQQIRNDCGHLQANTTTGALDYKITVSDFDANGFSLTPSASAASDVLAYMAIKFDAANSFKLVELTTPTATGSQAITGVGFRPQFALIVLTNMEAFNTAGLSDLSGALSFGFLGSEQWATSFAMDHGAATTDTATNIKQTAVLSGDGPTTTAMEATLTSMDSDGMTLNWSAVQANAKKGFILFVGE